MMKKFTSLLIGCSLALAGAAMAQQPEETATPKAIQEKTHGATAKPGANAVKPEATTKTQAVETKSANVVKPEATTAVKEHGAKTEQTTSRMLKTEATPKSEKTTATETKKLSSDGVKTQSETNVSAETAVSPTPGAKEHMGQGKRGVKSATENAKTSATPAVSVTPKGAKTIATPVTAAASATPAITPKASATPVATATATATPVAAASASATATVAPKGAAAKTPDVQQVQQIKAQHENFKAKPKPDKVPTVTFTANFQIQGSDRWQGPQYEVYRSYRPERHDRSWYHSRYQRVELVGGGYYYWNNGYWYPAWGYDNSAEYYAYDAPIYVGQRALPPDRVIADVQAVLQNMGYYKGEVDGLLGPLTREALTGYQADRGLTVTAVIDEPTLDALGMG
jgi:hypothetical protein